MKYYRKISDDYIEVTQYEIEGGDLNDNLIADVNHAVTIPILTHAEKTGILNYKVVVYAEKVK